MMDEESEKDEGYVTLVNAKKNPDGTITETQERTGMWAWKHPHQADGTVTYTELKGDVRFFDMTFGYDEDHMVLHDYLVCQTRAETGFCGLHRSRKDYNHEPNQPFLRCAGRKNPVRWN